MAPIYIPNELLAYATDTFRTATANELEEIILNFYDETAISSSKRLLWQHYKDHLPEMQSRRNTQKNPNNKKELETEDIVAALKKLDELYGTDDDVPVVFVAIRMKDIPNHRFISELSLRNRISVLESQMSEVLNSKRNYAATAAPVPNPQRMEPYIQRNRPVRPLPVVHHDPPTGRPDGPPAAIGTTAVNAPAAKPPEERPGHAPPINRPAAVSNNTSGDDVNDTQFQTVSYRRRRNRAVYGAAEADDIMAGGLQQHELFVFQVRKNVTENNVKTYMEKTDGVKVTAIKRMSTEEAPSNSYHVTVHCMDVRPIMDSTFWPRGVGCRKFRKKRIPQNGDHRQF